MCYIITVSKKMITNISYRGSRVAQWVRSLDLTTHTSLSPIRSGFAPSLVNYKKGCTRLAATSDKVYQLLAQGRLWFSPASSTTKTGRHDIVEILLKVALNIKLQIHIEDYFGGFENLVIWQEKKHMKPFRCKGQYSIYIIIWILALLITKNYTPLK